MAVMSFFILSGFVIAEAITTYYRGRPGPFLINRLLRIFPPFIVALGFSLSIHWAIGHSAELQFFDPISDNQKASMLSSGNILANALCLIIIYGLSHLGLSLDYLFVRFIWAVAVELHFYYVATLLALCSGLVFFRRLRLRQTEFWVLPSIGLAGAFVASMMSSNKLLFYGVWIPYFSLGVAIFHLISKSDSAEDDLDTGSSVSLNRWGILAALSLIGVNWHAYIYMSKNPANWTPVGLAILNLLVAGLFMLGRSTVAGRMKSLDKWIGEITYPLYLNHYAISIAVLSLVPVQQRGLALYVLNLLLCIMVSLALSYLSEPFTRSIRNRIRGASI